MYEMVVGFMDVSEQGQNAALMLPRDTALIRAMIARSRALYARAIAKPPRPR